MGTKKYLSCEWQFQLNTENHIDSIYVYGPGTVIIYEGQLSIYIRKGSSISAYSVIHFIQMPNLDFPKFLREGGGLP